MTSLTRARDFGLLALFDCLSDIYPLSWISPSTILQNVEMFYVIMDVRVCRYTVKSRKLGIYHVCPSIWSVCLSIHVIKRVCCIHLFFSSFFLSFFFFLSLLSFATTVYSSLPPFSQLYSGRKPKIR